MKKLIYSVIALVLLVSAIYAEPQAKLDWQKFSKNLALAVCSENDGLRNSAMCMMIQYADQLTFDRSTIYDIIRIFRNNEDDNVRLLAMVTLYKSEDPWAMDFLKRHRRFEENQRIKKLCCCAVKAYYAKMDSIREFNETLLVRAAERIAKDQALASAKALNAEQYGLK
ncbi:MAG: hypothetical protein EHM72_04185 [Calditrichaeota bacterium]|nr:MAG: hypothetical protein EHM72_04185 [Calditrichota bacterium]